MAVEVGGGVADGSSRVGGEHAKIGNGYHGPVGSSPRGRGTHRTCQASASFCRFIPAWALWILDIDDRQTLAFSADGIEALREIIATKSTAHSRRLWIKTAAYGVCVQGIGRAWAGESMARTRASFNPAGR